MLVVTAACTLLVPPLVGRTNTQVDTFERLQARPSAALDSAALGRVFADAQIPANRSSTQMNVREVPSTGTETCSLGGNLERHLEPVVILTLTVVFQFTAR